MNKIVFTLLFLFTISLTLLGQEAIVKVEPNKAEMELDQKLPLEVAITNSKGEKVKKENIRYYSRNERALSVSTEGVLTAIKPGETTVIIFATDESGERIRYDYPVKIKYPPIESISFKDVPGEIYAGTRIKLNVEIKDEREAVRTNVKPTLSSSNERVGTVDDWYYFTAEESGKTTISAQLDNIKGSVQVNVKPAPVGDLKLTTEKTNIRTGDVIHLKAEFKSPKGKIIDDLPVYYSFHGEADDISSSASGLIKQDGRFVADIPGIYVITASIGSISDQITIRANQRNVKRDVKFIGHGNVSDKHTSDFWIWEGVDGKDYGVTGTWGADGTAYFWDVTNPGNMVKIDSIQVDARTVNDVKISEDGKICIISREGASSRKNGIVIIDVTDPSNAEIISTFTENLTGGVHNLFIYKDHVYALSAARKYYVINIKDPKTPKIVGEFELDTPGHSIHDVWVEDGIAYSSNWSDGLQLVDVGNGIAGGSPSNPVKFASYAYPSGANHAAFPFKSESADKFYVIGGDEIFPYGLNFQGPNIAGGFLHFIDFSDLENPEEIARFEVPEAGSHNYWVKDEILYVAFYNGGVRMVDISGELMGDLYKQGREIGWYIPSSPEGYIPNSPFTWGAQPYKGHIFMSDWNSGLWSIKLEPEKPDEVSIESK